MSGNEREVSSRHNNLVCVGYYPVRIESAVGATGWTVRGSNPGGGEIFHTRPDRPWGPPSLLYSRYRIFPGGKAAGAWRWPSTPSSVEVKERVGLYLDSPCMPLWPVLGGTLPSSSLAWDNKCLDFCRDFSSVTPCK